MAIRAVTAAADSGSQRQIEYLSGPAPVSMADRWFEIAAIDHFWIKRRFAVLRQLANDRIASAQEMAEIGCGHGLLQRQVEDTYGKEVAGYDLNEYALRQNVSRHSRVCCYDISQMDASLRGRFDVIFLFDVLEHVTDEDAFLRALLFHLAQEGRVVINVPAGPWAFSAYDEAAGHLRRYSMEMLRKTARRNQLTVQQCTYWGLPLVPTLAVRKLWLLGRHDQTNIITTGFDTRTPAINSAMGWLSKLEAIPHKLTGTSLMAILGRGKKGELDGCR